MRGKLKPEKSRLSEFEKYKYRHSEYKVTIMHI
jgi:hypothetical protein